MTDDFTYTRTHPWLKFSIDLARASARLWLYLGECSSKIEHISRMPLRPEVAHRLHKLYLARGVRATVAIEGNTLSEEEILKIVDGAPDLAVSKEYLEKEAQNIIDVCNEIKSDIQIGQLPLVTVGRLKELNARVLQGLEVPDYVTPGEVATVQMGVARYKGAPPQECELLLHKLCEWLNSGEFNSSKSNADDRVPLAILRAIIAHLYLAWIHPFGDGNGRTARLIEFQILLTSGVPAPASQLLSNHYNETRQRYYQCLDRASKSQDGVLEFIEYAVEGFRDGLRIQLEEIWQQNYDVVWRNYVNESFRGQNKPTDNRRRELALDLSRSATPVSPKDVKDVSTRTARAYANKTDQTLMRDLLQLQKMGLIERTSQGYRARKEIILSYRPAQAATQPDGF